MLNKNSLIPLYAQLESILLDAIEKGELKPGDIIPSENELSKQYEVSRMTAKKAIDILTMKGILERVRGVGTFVTKKTEKIELPLNRLRGFTQRILEMGLIPENKVIKFSKEKASKEIGELLGVKEGEDLWYMERVRQIDGVPAVFEQTYIAEKMLPGLEEEHLMSSKYAYIGSLGLEIGDSEREISAEIPSDYIGGILNLKRNEPVLLAQCITYLKTGAVLEYSRVFYNQKKYRFKLTAENN